MKNRVRAKSGGTSPFDRLIRPIRYAERVRRNHYSEHKCARALLYLAPSFF